MADCPTRFTLLEYVSGDLVGEQAAAVAAHVEGCTACQAELAGIQANVDDYDQRQSEHLAALKARLEREIPGRGWIRRRWIPLLGAAAASAILVVLLLRLQPPGEDIGFRGAVSFQVVVKRGEELDQVRQGERLQEGDALRFVITSDRAGYLSVFSVEQRGGVNAFYPETSPGSDAAPMRIERAGRTELPGSVILDDWIGQEYLILVFSEQAFDRRRVHAEARRLVLQGQAGGIDAGALGVRGSALVLFVRKIARGSP